MRDYNICYSLDSKYIEQLLVSITSILVNSNESDNITFYVLDGGLTPDDRVSINKLKNIKNFNINYIPVKKSDFKACPMLKNKDEHYKNYHVTLPTYYRFKLAEYLPDAAAVLYLDCDVIVRNSLEELFSTDINEFAAAMVKDAESDSEAKRLSIKDYYNAGVMLINLDFWRTNNISEKLFEYARNNTKTILWQDQDVINAVLNGCIKPVDTKWNFQYFLYNDVNPVELKDSGILHLSGRFKPWLIPFEHPVYDLYYEYLALTDKRNNIVLYKQNSSGKFLKNGIGGSETNIRLSVSDEDIQKVYDEIAKSYDSINQIYSKIKENYDFAEDRVNKCEEKLQRETDEKLENVYNKIKENYDFAEDRVDKCEEKLQRETDEKLENVYNKIKENYDFAEDRVDKCEEKLQRETDEKLENVYNKIKENYDFAEYRVDKCEEKLQRETDEKLENVYNKIKENYDFAEDRVDKCEEKLQRETDEKLENVYKKIKENYDFAEDRVDKCEEKLQRETDEKLENVYNKIKENYDFVEDRVDKCEEKLQRETDEKLEKVFSDIDEVYGFTKKAIFDAKYEVTCETENKFKPVYEEITKNYKYTEEIVDKSKNELKNELDNSKVYLNSEISNLTNLFDKFAVEKSVIETNIENIKEECAQNAHNIKSLNDEVKRTASYVDFLVKSESEKQEANTNEKLSKLEELVNLKEQKLVNAAEKLQDNFNEFKQKYEVEKGYIYTDISDRIYEAGQKITNDVNRTIDELYTSTDEKLAVLKIDIETKTHDELNKIANDVKYDLQRLNTFVNESVTSLYKEIKDTNSFIENTFSNKLNNVYSVSEDIKSQIYSANESLSKKAGIEELSSAEKELKSGIEEIKENFEIQLKDLKEDYNRQLLNAKNDYENKTAKLVDKINKLRQELAEHKKSPFIKLMEKCKKRV